MKSLRFYAFILNLICINVAVAQDLEKELSPIAQQIIRLTDGAKFDSAVIVLEDWNLDTLHAAPQELALNLLIRGYFELNRAAGQYSFDLLVKAANAYEGLGNLEMMYYCEAWQYANNYNLDRWEETKTRGPELLKRFSPEALEASALVHSYFSFVHAGNDSHKGLSEFHGAIALNHFRPRKNYRRLYSQYGVFAAVYNSEGDYKTALAYIDSARFCAQKIDNQQELAFLKIREGNALISANRSREGREKILEADAYYDRHPSFKGEQPWALHLAANSFVEDGNYKKYYELRSKMDSISNIQKIQNDNRAIDDLLIKYETEKKERQLEVQALNLSAANQRFRLLSIIGVVSLGILSLIFYLIYARNKNREREKIRAKELIFQKDLLENSINVQEEERKRIARDLHDGIGQQLSGLKFGLEQYRRENADDQKLGNFISGLKDASIEVRNLSHQMMPKALQELGLTEALQDILDKSFLNSAVQCSFETNGKKIKLSEQVAIGVYRIVQELINNIIKHSSATEVEIILNMNEKRLLLMLEENGTGFQTNEDSNGHGLSNIKTRSQVLNAKINFEKVDSGMLTTLQVPL